MKRLLSLTHRAAARLSFAAIASALFLVAVPASAGIANTKHNLSPGSAAENKLASGTDEICVFCHTPHAADNSAPVPLWNKALPASGGYTTYATLNSGSIDGTILSVGSISLACLSCHDGAQAMDNIINAPGSGGYLAGGGGATGLAWSWTGAPRVDADGKLTNAATTLAMLGTDLSNDHPIGIHYCGGGPQTSAPAGACVDKDFTAPTNDTINTKLVWWVDTTGGTAKRDKSDMILYSRDFGGTIGVAPSVECGSCHDPHVQQGTGTPASGQTFLRIANTGSAVCLACHVK